MARAFVRNAIWTREQLLRVGGLLIDDLCLLCGKEPDTVLHRLWVCNQPDAVAIRAEAPHAVVRRAV